MSAGTQASASPLRIRGSVVGDEARIDPLGELDLTGVPQLERAFAEAEASHAECVVLDLGRLTFLDGAGLRCIMAAHTRFDAAQRPLLLRRGGRGVQRLFAVVGVEHSLYFLD